MAVCNQSKCERKSRARGMCAMHYKRWLRTGDPGDPSSVPLNPEGKPLRGYRVAVPCYGGMHQRIRRERGLASAHSCVDCGEPATEWTLIGDKEIITGMNSGCSVRYSLDVNDYEPRCSPCNHRP